jgi:hypothetical protein
VGGWERERGIKKKLKKEQDVEGHKGEKVRERGRIKRRKCRRRRRKRKNKQKRQEAKNMDGLLWVLSF